MLTIRNNDLYNSFFSTSRALATNVHEALDAYIFEVEMPGVLKDSIRLDLKNGYLTISVSGESKNDDKKYLVKEIKGFKSTRSFYVGDVEENSIKAKLENGILTIKLEKAQPKTKYIEIE